MPRRLAFAVLLLTTAACGGAPVPPEVGWVEREGFDPRVRARRVEEAAFSLQPLQVRAGADGSVWVYASGYATAEDARVGTSVQRLTHVGATGQVLTTLRVSDVGQFVVHPSGELTVVTRGLVLQRLRPDGTVLHQRPLAVDVPPGAALTYVIHHDATYERVVGHPVADRRLLRGLEADGEDALVLVHASGARVLRLGPALQTRWTGPALFPSVALDADSAERQTLGHPFDGGVLTLDAAGHAWVGALLPPVARAVYRDAFGQVPEGPDGNAVLVVGLDAEGGARVARTLPRVGMGFELSGLAVQGRTVAVGTSAFTPHVPPRPNDSVHVDLFVAVGDLDRPATEVLTRTLHLAEDDSPSAFFACGAARLCFAGHTGSVSVDTKSLVQEGRGFVLALDAQGAQHDLVHLGGPRHTSVAAAAPGPGGSVVLAVQANAPLTHTGDADPSLRFDELWVGVLPDVR